MKNDIEQRSAADEKATNAGTTNTQSVRIMGFVDGDVIPPACYDEPYCLQPGKDDDKAYQVLREVMHRTRKVGLAAVVIEKKQALAAVIPIGRTLVLNVLRLATALVPGAKRVMRKSTTPANLTSVKPRAVTAVAQTNTTRRRGPQATLSEAPKPAARMVPLRKHGEVIDLAVRRSSKRAAQGRGDGRPAKSARTRSANVATLHQLRRKSSGGRTPEIQLA